MTDTCRVVFVAGNGRSGSTLLDIAIGQMDGFFSGGEICLVWQRYLDREWLCGCGSVLAACEVWSEVMRDAYGTQVARTCSRIDAIFRRWRRLRYLCMFGNAASGALAEYRSAVAALYQALRRVTGCRVIVDSSKSLAYAMLLRQIEGVEVYPVHLVRDPRAVCHSRQRPRPVRLAPGASPRYFEVVSTTRAAINWSRVVLLNELRWWREKRALCVRYEDFVAQPMSILESIANRVGECAAGLQIQKDCRIRLRPTHTAGGNSTRFMTGDLPLRADEEWRDRMPLLDRVIASATCAPLLYLMRYPLLSMGYERRARHATDSASGGTLKDTRSLNNPL